MIAHHTRSRQKVAGTPALGPYPPRALRTVAPPLLPILGSCAVQRLRCSHGPGC